jgi:GNAT superfamily N-acetyltransferase
MSFPSQLKSAYDGEFYAAYLLRAFQRRGIGRAMFEGVKSGLKGRGFGSMLVWVLAENPAVHFYQAMGGIEAGRSKITIDRELENIAYGWEKI